MRPHVVLLPFDGSPSALRAAELVARYAGNPRRLSPVVLNVQMRPVELWPESALDITKLEAELIEAGRETLAPALERLRAAGLAPSGEVRLTRPRPSSWARAAPVCSMGSRWARWRCAWCRRLSRR